MKIIVLTSDAFGGRGGIALYNRIFLRSLCECDGVDEVTALPRTVTYTLETLPENLTFDVSGVGGKFSYLWACLRLMFQAEKADLIFCGHLHLLLFAYLIRLRHRCRIVPLTYGIEAWVPTRHPVVNYLSRHLDHFISIRKLTAQRFVEWAQLGHASFYYLPNSIDEKAFGPGEKRQDLLDKYDLQGARVVMTAGRLDQGRIDERKGFDEILEVLPELRKRVPDLRYLIVGDGEDRQRLEEKAVQLGVSDMVVFTGYVAESDKADYYRLADVFAMPGSSEIFDRYPFRFVFLEALACGIPVVGCRLEDAAESEDRSATELIIQVDPNDADSIISGVLDALNKPRVLNPAITDFYYAAYQKRLQAVLRDLSDV